MCNSHTGLTNSSISSLKSNNSNVRIIFQNDLNSHCFLVQTLKSNPLPQLRSSGCRCDLSCQPQLENPQYACSKKHNQEKIS